MPTGGAHSRGSTQPVARSLIARSLTARSPRRMLESGAIFRTERFIAPTLVQQFGLSEEMLDVDQRASRS